MGDGGWGMGESTCKGAKVEKCKAGEQESGMIGDEVVNFFSRYPLSRVGSGLRTDLVVIEVRKPLGWHAVPTLPRCRRHRTTHPSNPPTQSRPRKPLHVCTSRRPFCTFALHHPPSPPSAIPAVKMQLGQHAVLSLPQTMPRRKAATQPHVPMSPCQLVPSRPSAALIFALNPLFRLSLSGSRPPFELMHLPTPSPSALSQWS